ncbi:MAG: DUF2391 family protein [Candidatus Diapherotrites archaeon]|jgi:uncharacterized membrane protein|uniref:DUF2391 family protein n=1 Tax=Candidatus Iainarchaeum sp. TaxID=3101447 RepID=A0A8T5GEU3_9ARCH|nr:DUF2391 family protein [Candidatus Diapherotrites archaeon]MBT7241772.1 DUF2391 family protein [Candidatus Diapherotrites archaeon]
MVRRMFTRKKTAKKTILKTPHKETLETIEESVLDSGKDVDLIRKEIIDAGKDVDVIRESVIDSGKDVDEIKESVLDSGKDVDEIKEDVDEIKDDVDEIKEDVDEIIAKQKSLLKRIPSKLKPDKFAFDDIAQQIVGAIILSTPLAVTEEVWGLAGALDITRLILIVLVTLVFDILLIYYTKYQKVEKQNILNFIPLRLVSLLIVSYLAAGLILYLFGVIGGQVDSALWAGKLILFVGLFANIGAGAADILK